MDVKWFSGADRDLSRLRFYSEVNFGKETAIKIVLSVRQTIGLLSQFPNLGPLEPLLGHRQEAWRSLVIHRNVKVIYLIGTHTVNIAALWDTRQNSARLANYFDNVIEAEPSILSEPPVPYIKVNKTDK